jgi:hypothetical protein
MTPEQKAEILAARAALFERLQKTLQGLDEYVVALEEVARAAIALDAVAIAHYTQEAEFFQAQTLLHEALDAIDWMES